MPKRYGIEKEKALELRREGCSYNEISSKLGIAKSTLSEWFRAYIDLQEIKEQNVARNREETRVRWIGFNNERKGLLALKYENAEKEAIVSYETYKTEPLFVAGLMLYAGEGDQKSRSHIRISNIQWRIHSIFIKFTNRYLGYSNERICLEIIAYNDLDKETIETFWKDKLQLGKLYKTQFIKGKSKNRLQYGVGMTIINDTRAKVVLLKWIDLYLNEYAGMVQG